VALILCEKPGIVLFLYIATLYDSICLDINQYKSMYFYIDFLMVGQYDE